MSRWLRLEFSLASGGKRTLSFYHGATGISLDRIQAIATAMINSGHFTVGGVALMALIAAYFEETTITEVV